MTELTQTRLKELVHYDPSTGVFTWLVNSGRRRAGAVAGTLSDGYLVAHIDGKLRSLHRLVWLYMFGLWPAELIDHRDGVRNNNRLSNLREATYSGNAQNQKQASRNTSGVIGVTRYRGKWRAQISVDGQYRGLGKFSTIGDASTAYLEAKKKLHLFQRSPTML